MPALMAAADALVENAGGLTCMEAFAVGLPVITFQPIAGHGKDNAEIHGGLGRQPLRARRGRAARGARRGDRRRVRSATRWSRRGPLAVRRRPADDVVELASKTRVDAARRAVPDAARAGAGSRPSPRRWPRSTCGSRSAPRASPRSASAWPSRRRRPRTPCTSACGSTAAELRTTQLVRPDPADWGSPLVVDGRTAVTTGHRLEVLAAEGVDIANGGWGKGHVPALEPGPRRLRQGGEGDRADRRDPGSPASSCPAAASTASTSSTAAPASEAAAGRAQPHVPPRGPP